MTGSNSTLLDTLAANRTALRRARNLRAAERGGAAPRAAAAVRDATRRPRGTATGLLVPALVALCIAAGAFALAWHARALTAAAAPAGAGTTVRTLGALQPALPGLAFRVPDEPGISLARHEAGTLLVVAGMDADTTLRIDLCSQLLDPARPRLIPIRIGYQFDEVARLAARNASSASPATLRNIVLARPGDAMPKVEIGGLAVARFAHPDSPALTLGWEAGQTQARWIGDGSGGVPEQGSRGKVALRQEGWLVWGSQDALRVVRRASPACPQAGELVLQRYRADPAAAGRARAFAFGAHASVASVALAPGEYRVPPAPPQPLEDQALFERLHERGLARLAPSGLVELAPRDLAAWRTLGEDERTSGAGQWAGVTLDDEARKLLQRLYHRADGAYVREQVRIFNSERRLLAWRVRPGGPDGAWQAVVGGVATPVTDTFPAAALRLFARLPQGWSPWSRIAEWPRTAQTARLAFVLPKPAHGGERLQLLVAGRVRGIAGARLRAAPRLACTGRACPAPDAAQELDLELEPGVRSVTLEVAPLGPGVVAGAGDARYRHLRVDGGRLAWQPLPAFAGSARPAVAAAAVSLADRHGAPLWSGGSATAASAQAGLAPLLGVHPDHPNSVAGMLARLPGTRTHEARLTLDLGLQAAAQAALECVGLRGGAWDGRVCSGGSTPPAGRQAGLVMLDAETGDILAAAGTGTEAVTRENWNEVRDFDRIDAARSPLRLPALQHDGGVHRGAGSTFKVVTALGLELAARGDPRIEALLQGMPLGAINREARERGFAFRTDAATYPTNMRRARITNFRDQHLDRRAEDGRLGLAQALTYSLNTWFAWMGELGDGSLFGRAEGGVPGLRELEHGALDQVRPAVAMAHRLGFGRALRLDGGLLPPEFAWSEWDALQASPARIDPINSRHELRQMAIGLRMQVTPLQMALVSAAVGQGQVVAPRLLLELDGRSARSARGAALGVRLDRIRTGMKGVVDSGTAASAFRDARLDALRPGLYGKTGTAPSAPDGLATVWFTGWLEPGRLPGMPARLAFAAFVSHSKGTGGGHAAPLVAAVLRSVAMQNKEQKGN